VTDDTPYILAALRECNNGGHAVFREGVQYFIATAMDLTFLNHIDIGTI
jgi:galacturan 1,4-alpha-galacturonidase